MGIEALQYYLLHVGMIFNAGALTLHNYTMTIYPTHKQVNFYYPYLFNS